MAPFWLSKEFVTIRKQRTYSNDGGGASRFYIARVNETLVFHGAAAGAVRYESELSLGGGYGRQRAGAVPSFPAGPPPAPLPHPAGRDRFERRRDTGVFHDEGRRGLTPARARWGGEDDDDVDGGGRRVTRGGQGPFEHRLVARLAGDRRPCGDCSGCAAAAARAAKTKALVANERLMRTVFLRNVYADVPRSELSEKFGVFGEVRNYFKIARDKCG